VEDLAFIVTIFALTLGPMNLIPAFAALTHDDAPSFRRRVALRGALVATAIVLFIAVTGAYILAKYRISLEALEIATGAVLAAYGFGGIFQRPRPAPPAAGPMERPTAMRLATSPVAQPMIVTPVGIAAILAFVLAAHGDVGRILAIIGALLVIMALDLLAMWFAHTIVTLHRLMTLLQILAPMLTFVQIALAIEIVLTALRGLGVVRG